MIHVTHHWMQYIDNETGNIVFVDRPMPPSFSAMSMISPPPMWIHKVPVRLLSGSAVAGIRECLLSAQLRVTSLSLWICDQSDHSDSFIYLSFYVFRRGMATILELRYGYHHWFWNYLSLQWVDAILWLRDFAILLFGGRLSHFVLVNLCGATLADRHNHIIAKSHNRKALKITCSLNHRIQPLQSFPKWFEWNVFIQVEIRDRAWTWSCATFDSSKYELTDCGTFSWSYLCILSWWFWLLMVWIHIVVVHLFSVVGIRKWLCMYHATPFALIHDVTLWFGCMLWNI